MQQTTNFNYTTQLNNFGICAIVLNKYNSEYIQVLKNNGFRYFSKTHEWSKPGFKNLEKFNNYIIALFNNDTKLLKQLQPKKDDIIKQCIELKKHGIDKKKLWINEQNEKAIQRLLQNNILDRGCCEIVLSYCIKNKINFWSITTEQTQQIIVDNETIMNDIIEYNKNMKIQNCTWLENLYNDGLPF